jgi:hypothetical protein
MPDEDYLQLANTPLLVIALGLQRRAFKRYTNLQSLVKGTEYQLEWRDDLLDQPFFCAAGPRGMSVDHSKPMTDRSARDFLCHAAERAGLGGRYQSRRTGTISS